MIKLVFFLAILLAGSLAELLVLTDENFDEQFASNDWLVKFYTPWCKHCKKLKPVFEELGSKVSHAGIGEIDCTKHKVTAKKFNITSYPTIIYRQDGYVGRYHGPRTIEGLTAFLDRLNAPASIDITDISDVKDHSAIYDGVSFVLVHHEDTEITSEGIAKLNERKTTFKQVAGKLKQHAFFAILAVDPASELGRLGPVSVLKVEHGRPHVVMPNVLEASAEAMATFVEHNNYPLISKYDNHNFKRLSHIPNKYIVSAAVDYARTTETPAILAALEHALSPAVLSTVAPEVVNRFIFGHLDGVKWSGFMKHHRTMVPAILVLDQARDLHQTFPLSVSAADLPRLNEQVASIVLTLVDTVDQQDRWVVSHVPTLFEKLQYRFKKYFPYSLLVLLLPVAFFVFACVTPYPKERKVKQH